MMDWIGQIALGTALTLVLALTTLPFGLSLGLMVGLAARSRTAGVRAASAAFTTAFRGLPELLTLIVVYYGGQDLLNGASMALGMSRTIEISPFGAGVLSLGLVFGAFSSEVFRGALAAVSKGQNEAAAVLGLSRLATFRDVIMPQVWRAALPGLSNVWIVMLKDTSLVSVIALNDLMRAASNAVTSTKQPFEFYGAACLIYLALTSASSIVLRRLEFSAGRGYLARS